MENLFIWNVLPPVVATAAAIALVATVSVPGLMVFSCCPPQTAAVRVLEELVRAERPLGAYDIAERLSKPGRRVAPVSVYRALDFLMELGLVHRIASRNAFVSCGHAHTEGAGLVFLICRNCGTIDETTSPEVEDQLGRTLAKAGFKPTSRILEVEGECGACLGRTTAE